MAARSHTPFALTFVVASLLLGAQQASCSPGRALSTTDETRGRRLSSKCVDSTSGSLTCQGYPYPACCSESGSCVTYSKGTYVTCTDPRTPYPGCCSEDSSKCFPAAAQVETPHGKKAMSSLAVGDKVLSVDSTGRLHFETVYMFSHHDSDAAAQFVALRTSANTTVRLTPGHYIWATPGAAAVRGLRFAAAAVTKPEDLAVGDFLWVSPVGPTDSVEPAQIMEIAYEQGSGLFNPHVPGGTIVVDGVAALAFPSTLFPSVLAHRAVTFPARALYALLPTDALAMRVNMGLLRLMGKAN